MRPEFNDKWSVWFEDLVGMTEILSTSARRPRIEGRNSFDRWIREQMQNNRPMSEIARATLTATGNNYYTENGPASFMVLGSAAMGPVQDTYDLQLVKSVRSYLGVGHYDCLLCHSGRNHLDQIDVVGRQSDTVRCRTHGGAFRANSAEHRSQCDADMNLRSIRALMIQDVDTGGYNLNTTCGQPPNSHAGRNRAHSDAGVSRRHESDGKLARSVRKQS